jgi:hypothetical protein
MNAHERRRLRRKYRDVLDAATVVARIEHGAVFSDAARYARVRDRWAQQADSLGDRWLASRGLK